LSEEDAKKQFMTMLMVPDWKLKIAPPEWEIEDTLYPDLAEIMQRGSKVRLQKINTKSKYFYLAVGAGALIALWILYNIFISLFSSIPKVPVIVPIQPKTIQTEEIPPEPKPWENLPVLEQQLNECYLKTMDLIKILPPGWDIGGITCSVGSATTSWARVFGRISIIDKALDMSGVKFSAKSISDDGNSVMGAVSFNPIGTELSEPTKNMVDIKNNLNDLFQSLGLSVSLTDNVYTSPQNNIYRSVTFKFQSNYNPRIWNEMLSKFSGITINLIKYNTATGVWEYEGAIYAI
jgi:hypothetical protein